MIPRAQLFHHRLHGLWLALLLIAAPGLRAQEDGDEPVVHPTGTAIVTDGSGQLALSYSSPPRGPVFALAPLTARYGLELRIGPLHDSHTLILGNRTVIAGPDSPLVVITDDEGEQELITLSQKPAKTIDGLKVPLDFLERMLGDHLGYDFVWDPATRRLDVSRRELRQISGEVLRIRQGRVTVVQISFSQAPRYRVSRQPGMLDIDLVGDRLQLARPVGGESDPLVSGVEVSPTRVRILLGDGAAAAEPRLIERPPRLIVEVFRQLATDDRGAPPVANASSGRLRTIVLDPGHGGEETGAVRGDAVEKELTLEIARELRTRLMRRLPVVVEMTRNRDTEVDLDRRTAIANELKADLFISLHVNSVFGTGARGAETYFLSREASDPSAADSAAFENRPAGSGGGDDPEHDLQLILWDLAQSHHLAESQRFASIVQEELNQTLGLRNRGVKQAPFRVLMGANMPAVLVEIGFLSNPEEAAKLLDPTYRSSVVDALVRAVERFRQQLTARRALNEESTP